MTKTIVKRSPYKVGQVLNQTKMKQIIRGKTIPSCGGYKVTSVAKLTHASGGYIISIRGRRHLNGSPVTASFIVTFPLLGRKTRRAYHTAFRYFTNQPTKHVNKAPSQPVKVVETKHISKTVPAGNRKKMLLIDFLEE